MIAWFEQSIHTLLDRMRQKGKIATPEQMKKAHQMIHELSTCSDTKGIRFTGAALHQLYYETKFARRGKLLYSVLAAIITHPSCVSLRSSVWMPLVGFSTTPLRVMSVGGGPGTDASGLVWIAREHLGFLKFHPKIMCYLMDNETSWKRHEAIINQLFAPHVQAVFTPGDVCQPISHDKNRYVLFETEKRESKNGISLSVKNDNWNEDFVSMIYNCLF